MREVTAEVKMFVERGCDHFSNHQIDYCSNPKDTTNATSVLEKCRMIIEDHHSVYCKKYCRMSQDHKCRFLIHNYILSLDKP